MKGQIPVLEMIAVTIILFVSFSILFPQSIFSSRWRDADLVLTGRDVMLTADRIGQMGLFSSDPSALADFLNKTISEKNFIFWTTIDGTVQNRITVACNCTTQQIDSLLNWIGRMRINGRNIQLDVLASSLSPIQESDVLLIWGRTSLGPYRDEILSYLKRGNGVVGIADVTDPDAAYTEIFGVTKCDKVLKKCDGKGKKEITFIEPSAVPQLTYQPYKLFHHVPVRSPDSPVQVPIVPVKKDLPPCATIPVFQGTFGFKTDDYTYWICNSTTIYFDTNQNNEADKIVKLNENFEINKFNFKMSYIDLNRTFISFKPEFVFDDFRNEDVNLFPADGDVSKILLEDGTYGGGGNANPIPVVVANGTNFGKTMWGVDFLSGSPVRHDRRLLIASMLFASANKKSKEPVIGNVQVGFLTPYINVINQDMLEIYQFGIGLGYPF